MPQISWLVLPAAIVCRTKEVTRQSRTHLVYANKGSLLSYVENSNILLQRG